MNQLPPAVARYIEAANAQDAQGVAAAFLADGAVHDEGHLQRGRAEIAAWALDTGRRYRATMAPRSVEQEQDRCTVRAEVSGNFAGSPIMLAFHFALRDGAIASLEVTP